MFKAQAERRAARITALEEKCQALQEEVWTLQAELEGARREMRDSWNGCTGYVDYTGNIAHDGDMCPVHEGSKS
jgi:hypothetical protein